MSETYQQRIERQTGRKILKARIGCDMCNSNGFSMFEPQCTNCDGEGMLTAWVFECGHMVESDDCDDCIEPCELLVDLGQRCGKPVTSVISEPFTPSAFEIRCCDEHAKSLRKQGYKLSEAA